jgi:hypothetical protein
VVVGSISCETAVPFEIFYYLIMKRKALNVWESEEKKGIYPL